MERQGEKSVEDMLVMLVYLDQRVPTYSGQVDPRVIQVPDGQIFSKS